MTVAEQLCDRVAFIVEGKIVVFGSPKDLMIEHGKRIVNVEYQYEWQTSASKVSI
jgi:fluoroquinolone transport system ATP-binding protein